MTVKVWTEAFSTALGRADEDLDNHRIKAGFKKARPTLTKWPMPAQIIELMPRRPEAKRLTYDPPADSQSAAECFKLAMEVADGKISVDDALKKMGVND